MFYKCRGITVLSLPGKAYTKILERRIWPIIKMKSKFRRSNAVFFPAVEHLTNSLHFTGCMKVQEFAHPVNMC